MGLKIDRCITPMIHYIFRYPDLILRLDFHSCNKVKGYAYERYGYLVQSLCMRFEGKHNYFKGSGPHSKCFQNIPKTA